MNIEGSFNGVSGNLKNGLSESSFATHETCQYSRPCIELGIPILFTEISTVADQGISQVVARFQPEENKEFKIVTDVMINAYGGGTKGPEITKMPLLFQADDDKDRNRLLFTLCLGFPESSPFAEDFSGLDGKDLKLKFEFTFSSLTSLHLLVPVTLKPSTNSLEVGLIDRVVPAPRLIPVNLFLILFYVITTGMWNFYLNDSVHLQNPVTGKIAAVMLGIFVAFLGISVSRLKSWFKTITHIYGFINFPELHLPPATIRMLGTRKGFSLVVAALIVTGVLIWDQWSLELPQDILKDGRFAVYDIVETEFVVSKRIYHRDLKQTGRFQVVCGLNNKLVALQKKIFLGEIKLSSSIWMRYIRAKFDGNKMYFKQQFGPTISFNAKKPDKSIDDTELLRIIENVLSGQQVEGVSLCENVILYTRARIMTADSLRNIAADAENEIVPYEMNSSEIYEKREFLHEELKQKLKASLENTGYDISASVLVEVTKQILENVDSSQEHLLLKEVKAFILLRGLWSAAKNSTVAVSEKQIEETAKTVQVRLCELEWSANHNKALATLWEFLLEIEKLFPSYSQTRIHEAAIGFEKGSYAWLIKQEPAATARYLRCCLRLLSLENNEGGNARRAFFHSRFISIRQRLGEKPTLQNYFLTFFENINEKLDENEKEVLEGLFTGRKMGTSVNK